MKTGTQKQRQIGWKTMMIKSKATRQILRFFHKKDEFFKLSDKEKLEAISKIANDTYWELRNYKSKRKEKSRIEKLRIERGVKSKKKTSLKEYQEQQNNLQKIV